MIYHCPHCGELFQVDGFGVLCFSCVRLYRARNARYLEGGTDGGGVATEEPDGSASGSGVRVAFPRGGSPGPDATNEERPDLSSPARGGQGGE